MDTPNFQYAVSQSEFYKARNKQQAASLLVSLIDIVCISHAKVEFHTNKETQYDLFAQDVKEFEFWNAVVIPVYHSEIPPLNKVTNAITSGEITNQAFITAFELASLTDKKAFALAYELGLELYHDNQHLKFR